MTVDLTSVIVAIIGGVFTILAIVIPVWVQSRMKDKDAAQTVSNAVKNSLGAIQQAAQTGVRALDPKVTLPAGVSPNVAAGVQYVLDNAGDEAARLGVTPELIASKINAQIGLTNIAANLATAASPLPTPRPLDPVLVSTTKPAVIPLTQEKIA